MVQQLLRGNLPAQKPPDVVEVMSNGLRVTFNMDSVERVLELEKGTCAIQLQDYSATLPIDMSYDSFLLAAKVQPRVCREHHRS